MMQRDRLRKLQDKLRLENEAKHRQELARRPRMPISYDPTSIGMTPCSCGRLKAKIHCPECGGYVIYKTQKTVTRIINVRTGETQEFPIIVCRRCGLRFDDWEWQNNCHATPFVTKSGQKRVEQARQA